MAASAPRDAPDRVAAGTRPCSSSSSAASTGASPSCWASPSSRQPDQQLEQGDDDDEEESKDSHTDDERTRGTPKPSGRHDDHRRAKSDDGRHCLEEETAATTTTPTRRQVALHRDAIQSVLDFLARKEFSLLARTSPEFLSVAGRLASRRWRVECTDQARLAGLLASPLRKHVASLHTCLSVREPHPRLVSTAAELHAIAERMAHLEGLQCALQLTSDMPTPRWPANLRRLDLGLVLDTNHQPRDEVARLMAMIGESLLRHAPLVEELTLRCVRKAGDKVAIPGELLAPLLQWPLLKEIVLCGPLSPSACAIVRRMEHLTDIRLDLQQQFVELMSADGPVPPRLEEIHLARDRLFVNEDTLPLLLKLPSLRRLCVTMVVPDLTPLVPILSQLRSLQVSRGWCDTELFVSALRQATQLTDFYLFDNSSSQSDLASIIRPMVHLQRLDITSSKVTSLDFLAESPTAAHWAETLKELRFVNCRLDPTEVLLHLRPLRALETIDLDYCFDLPQAAIDPATFHALTPGADGFERETWPRLRCFRWSAHL